MKIRTFLKGSLLGLFALSGTAAAKESGERGNTQDINIGVGELQEDKQEAKRKTAMKKRKKVASKKAKKKPVARKIKGKTKPDGKAADKAFIREADSADGTKKKKKGNVEYSWKVEEGES